MPRAKWQGHGCACVTGLPRNVSACTLSPIPSHPSCHPSLWGCRCRWSLMCVFSGHQGPAQLQGPPWAGLDGP